MNDTWHWLQDQYDYVEIAEYVVMPNHSHAIIVMAGWGGSRTAPTGRKTIGRLIGAFKTVSTKQMNILRNTPGAQIWQRDFYEHIIRNEDEYQKIAGGNGR